MGSLCEGSKNKKSEKQNKNDENKDESLGEEVNKNSFNFEQIIGVSKIGKTWKVQCKKTKQYFALKEISKAKTIDKNLVNCVINEREILSKLHCPLLLTLEYSFQEDENLYLVSKYLPCGDLKFHISKYKCFSEHQLKFVVICTILGLEYLHANNIVHLDIRPENLVLDDQGYIRIVNYLSSRVRSAKEKEKKIEEITNENPIYFAPEILHGAFYSYYSDYYSLGILCYEIMQGHKPYSGVNKREIKEKIMIKQYLIKQEEIPKSWSVECADFINKLIIRKPMDRLGFNGIEEIKNHPWFATINWKDYYDKKLKSPFIDLNVQEAYSRVLLSPEKKGEKKKYYELLKKNKSSFKEFIYYDIKSINNLNSKSVGFYNPQTKKRYRPEWDVPSLKQLYDSGEATVSNSFFKSSQTKRSSNTDLKSVSLRSTGSKNMRKENSLQSKNIDGTNIFNNNIVQ